MADVALDSSGAEEESRAYRTITQSLQKQDDDCFLCWRKHMEPFVLPRLGQLVHSGICEAYLAKDSP